MILAINVENHRPLKDLVYEELKKHIITGALTPETKIQEMALAKKVRTSRTPIREALKKLEKEGFITIVPRQGAYVKKLCTKDVIDALEVRETLEGLATSLLVKKVKKEEIIRLKRATDNYNRAVAENNLKGMLKYDTEFHQTIIEACGNSTLIQMSELLHDIVLRYRHAYYGELKTLKKLSEEHEMILHAIQAGHSEEAKTYMKTHISDIRNFIISTQ